MSEMENDFELKCCSILYSWPFCSVDEEEEYGRNSGGCIIG
jgi:hypothetical protein